MNVYYSKTSGKYSVKQSDKIDPLAIAYANYSKTYETKGWDFLKISSYMVFYIMYICTTITIIIF